MGKKPDCAPALEDKSSYFYLGRRRMVCTLPSTNDFKGQGARGGEPPWGGWVWHAAYSRVPGGGACDTRI